MTVTSQAASSLAAMSPAASTPTVGQLLPRAANAYMTPEKLNWILAERGHGQEWARVFRIGPNDAEPLWNAIAQAVLDAPVFRVINRGKYGIVCGVVIQLTFNLRTATVATSWHYASADEAPRPVTAYPTSYYELHASRTRVDDSRSGRADSVDRRHTRRCSWRGPRAA
jgi:hypothetical protein